MSKQPDPQPDETEDVSDSTDPQGPAQLVAAPDVDWLLQNLTALANNVGIELGITLNLSGGIVSGQLISGQKFFAAVVEQVRQAEAQYRPVDAQPHEDELGLSGAIREYGKIYDRPASDDPASDDFDPSRWSPHFVHLRDARFFTPGQPPMPSGQGMMWRGRISEISGMSVGQLQQAPALDEPGTR